VRKFKVKLLKCKGDWISVRNSARNTVNKGPIYSEVSTDFKRKILMAEHSPIRKLQFEAIFEEIESFVSTHLVRHKNGVEHFVTTRRSDRTGVNRCQLSQCELVDHEIDLNAQACIFISRKRKCLQADPATRGAWNAFIDALAEFEPELASRCVRECVYRNGLCPEMQSCGFNQTKAFAKELRNYLKGFEGQVTSFYRRDRVLSWKKYYSHKH
jgi:hypothetical protein